MQAHRQPFISATYPRVVKNRRLETRLFCLAPDRVFPKLHYCNLAYALTARFHPYFPEPKPGLSGIFSVALSVGFHPPHLHLLSQAL